jgi:hypothetical protein
VLFGNGGGALATVNSSTNLVLMWNSAGSLTMGTCTNPANYSLALGKNATASSDYAAVAGGVGNKATGTAAFVGGGGSDGSSFAGNTASGPGAGVLGGTQNTASSSRSAVGGGHSNSATNYYATVPGGAWNIAGGTGSFAAGQAAQALSDGSFVWNCDWAHTLTASTANQFLARASGGFSFYTGSSGTGANLAAGGGSWTSMSDRNAKEHFAPVDASAVLNRVTALPLSTWNYKSQDPAIRHIGPMAQDFKTAFGVGESDTGITTVDADGVALAAIQGLNQKLEETRAENAQLKARLEKLERLLEQRNGAGQ